MCICAKIGWDKRNQDQRESLIAEPRSEVKRHKLRNNQRNRINMKRRDFIKKAGFAAVASTGLLAGLSWAPKSTKKAIASIPVLHGDGFNDDTAALQAAFDGKRYIQNGVMKKGGSVMLRGTYLVSSPIVL